jgi:hypothetical protein
MGMQQAVHFPDDQGPSWPAVRDVLAGAGFPAQVRMIDGELAFPDEEPPERWRELRLGTPQGMVTVRREPGRVEVVTWGNADTPLRQAWNAVAWAFAAAGSGTIETPSRPLSAYEFHRAAELPEVVRRSSESGDSR